MKKATGVNFATLCLISNGYLPPPQILCRNAKVTQNRLITSREGDDETQWFAENRQRALTPAHLQKLRKFLGKVRSRGAYPLEIAALLDVSETTVEKMIEEAREAGWLIVEPTIKASRRKVRLAEYTH